MREPESIIAHEAQKRKRNTLAVYARYHTTRRVFSERVIRSYGPWRAILRGIGRYAHKRHGNFT